MADNKLATPVYAFFSETLEAQFTTNVKEVQKQLSTPELRETGRFLTFKSVEEGEEFFKKNSAAKIATPERKNQVKLADGYRSPHPKIKPQDHSAFAKHIQNLSQVNEVLSCINKNPNYYIDMANDKPAILHAGCRYNALHLCARYDNIEVAKEVMTRISDPKHISDIYQTSVNALETSETLMDRFLNTPDKTSSRTPILWATRQGFADIVQYLTSFVEVEIPNNALIKANMCQSHDRSAHTVKCARIYAALSHPTTTYCVTLYREINDDELPFLAITSRFPEPHVPANKKQTFFKYQNISSSPKQKRQATPVRLSKFIDGETNSERQIAVHATTSYFVPYLAVGVFGDKNSAVGFYNYLLENSRIGRQTPNDILSYFENKAVATAGVNDYFVFYPKSSGLIVSYEKRKQYYSKFEMEEKENSLDMSMVFKKFEELTVKEPEPPKHVQSSDDGSDEETFYTAPNSPA